MKKYLVGGAVRDALLGLSVKDRDYVVVGSSPEELLSLGYEQVGMGFPVFLHPRTGEEYALARREKKVGVGYTGFEFEAGPTVTLEDDLQRRDLTINSIARDENGRLVDPCGGLADLEAKVLRHTSSAFVEDPLRVVRLARFATRFAGLGFTVAPETLDLCRKVVDSGELDALPDNRFWLELEKVFSERNPSVFFQVLHTTGALDKVRFFKRLLGKDFSFDRVVAASKVFACNDRLPISEKAHAFATFVVQNPISFFHSIRWARPYEVLELVRSWQNLDPSSILQVFHRTRAFDRHSTVFHDLLVLVRTHEDLNERLAVTADQLHFVWEECRFVNADPFLALGLQGAAIGSAMDAGRLEILQQFVM